MASLSDPVSVSLERVGEVERWDEWDEFCVPPSQDRAAFGALDGFLLQ